MRASAALLVLLLAPVAAAAPDVVCDPTGAACVFDDPGRSAAGGCDEAPRDTSRADATGAQAWLPLGVVAAFGERRCYTFISDGGGEQQGVAVYALGGSVRWYEWHTEHDGIRRDGTTLGASAPLGSSAEWRGTTTSTALGRSESCFVYVSATLAVSRSVSCRAATGPPAPLNPGWGHLVP